MSGIGAIGSSGSEVLQRLQRAFSHSGGLSVGGSSGASESPLSAMRSNLQASGVDVQQLDSLQDKIKSAISSAVQDAQSSGGSTDMRQVIEGAVDKTLKDNGIDPDKLKQQMKSAMGGMGGMMPSGIGGMNGSTTSSEIDALFGDNSSTSDTSGSKSKSSNKNDQTNTQLSQSLQDWLYKLLGNQSGKDSQLGLLLDSQG